MATVVLKLFAGEGTGRKDGQNGNYMLPPLGSIKRNSSETLTT